MPDPTPDAERELSPCDDEPDPEAPADELDPSRYAREPDETYLGGNQTQSAGAVDGRTPR